MVDSQNGYSVIAREQCTFYDNIVPGLSLPLRPDDCGYVLAHFLRRFNQSVEPLNKGDTYGHAMRMISGSDEWSNHASATAADANSVQHPQGHTGTFTVAELQALDNLLEEYDNVIRWGGTFRTTKDEMHFEIDRAYAEVHLLTRILKRDNTLVLSRLAFGNRNLDVYMVKRALKKQGFFTGELSNYYGKGFTTAYAAFQRSLGYTGDDADGTPGVASLGALGFTVREA